MSTCLLVQFFYCWILHLLSPEWNLGTHFDDWKLHFNIISNGSAFKLGFFSPVNSTSRYLGIWYNNVSVCTVIWVSIREKPLKDSSRVLTIFDDGTLIILNGQKVILWSSNVTSLVVSSSGQLLDSWNLVLQVGQLNVFWA